MNYQAAMFYLTLVMTIVNIIIAISVWFNNKEKVTNTRFKEAEDRLGKVETRCEKMPVCDNHARMESNDKRLFQRLDGLHGDIEKIGGGVSALHTQVTMVLNHLIGGGK